MIVGKFDGKILLELGTNVGSIDIVKYAKSEGAYVIVTDYLPIEKSEAKKYADETAMISTLDVEAIYKYAKEKNIDGIFCGVSEAALEVVCEVAERLELPCYLNKQYFRLNQDKLYFKKMCQKYGIAAPKLFTVIENNIFEVAKQLQFPVVVKPNDQSSGTGVSICNSTEELIKAYKNAQELSKSNTAFVEEYIVGDEVTVVYSIKDGVVSLSCMTDKFLSQDHTDITSLNDVLIKPSHHLHSFISTQNDKVINFLKSELYTNGTVFLQGIYKDGLIYFIEMGCRMSGGADYRIIEHENGISFMKMLVDYALLGSCEDFDISRDNPHFKTYSGNFKLIAHGGQIGKMTGVEEVRLLDGVLYANFRKSIGDIIPEDGSLRQYIFECFFSCSTLIEVSNLICKIQYLVKVENINGDNMLFKPFDVSRLLV